MVEATGASDPLDGQSMALTQGGVPLRQIIAELNELLLEQLQVQAQRSETIGQVAPADEPNSSQPGGA